MIFADKSFVSRLQVQNFSGGQLFAAERASETTKVVHFITSFANKVLVVNLLATPSTFRPETPAVKNEQNQLKLQDGPP